MNSNMYVTTADFKQWLLARGQSVTDTTDAADDLVMASIVERVSREMDFLTKRTYYPRYEIRYFDVPRHNEFGYTDKMPRELIMDDDLLSPVTILNGDGTTITAYNLEPKNQTPANAIKLKFNSVSPFWLPASDGGWESVISIEGWWGYRRYFSQAAWSLGGTLGAAMTDTTTLAFTMTAGHALVQNQIIKIDNEIMNIASVSTNTITPNSRGDNGSTAATHLNGASVYIWMPQDEIKECALEISQNIYSARSGQTSQGRVTVTAAGIVIRPEDIPDGCMKILNDLKRLGV